jgi:hypothetical protein
MTEGSTAPSSPPAPKKGSRCLALGCALMLGGCVLLIGVAAVREAMKSPEQKAAEAKARTEHMAALKEKDRQAAVELSRRFAAIARQLPAQSALAELPNPELAGKTVAFTPADPGFFGQFDDTGYVSSRDSPHVWYRSTKLDEAKQYLAKVAKNEDYYFSKVESISDELSKKSYVGVFYPVVDLLPKISEDGKTFVPGLFDGWVVVVDLATAKVVRIARFQARSSDKVKDRHVKVVGIKVGADAQKRLDEDFRTNVLTAALEAIAR